MGLLPSSQVLHHRPDGSMTTLPAGWQPQNYGSHQGHGHGGLWEPRLVLIRSNELLFGQLLLPFWGSGKVTSSKSNCSFHTSQQHTASEGYASLSKDVPGRRRQGSWQHASFSFQVWRHSVDQAGLKLRDSPVSSAGQPRLASL